MKKLYNWSQTLWNPIAVMAVGACAGAAVTIFAYSKDFTSGVNDVMTWAGPPLAIILFYCQRFLDRADTQKEDMAQVLRAIELAKRHFKIGFGSDVAINHAFRQPDEKFFDDAMRTLNGLEERTRSALSHISRAVRSHQAPAGVNLNLHKCEFLLLGIEGVIVFAKESIRATHDMDDARGIFAKQATTFVTEAKKVTATLDSLEKTLSHYKAKG